MVIRIGFSAILGCVLYLFFGGNMKYFKPYEFGKWWLSMSPDLLQKLDAFREEWGAPVRISPHPDALGRHLGVEHLSQHNIDRWGEVRAVDIFPKGMDTVEDMSRAYDIARRVGFTGIGIYTDTKPSNMMHLDVRTNKPVGKPAKWSRIAGVYNSIERAFV